MKNILLTLSVITILHLGWAQDIVLKAEFFISSPNIIQFYQDIGPQALDLNDDGIKELTMVAGEIVRFVDPTTLLFVNPALGENFYYYGSGLAGHFPFSIRRPGLAEIMVSQYLPYRVVDYITGETLISSLSNNNPYVFDYDNDGVDDLVIIDNSYHCQVYGIATGTPHISPPQELDIQQVGEDFVIGWDSVQSATAYRVEWSSALDGGVRFTRIGYTQETSFIHRNQVGQERGFYRVLSEDNGTGVVRMVGQTPRGER